MIIIVTKTFSKKKKTSSTQVHKAQLDPILSRLKQLANLLASTM